MNNKSDLFKKQLAYIKNDKVRNFVVYALDNAHSYFFYVSASSTSKYHPLCSIGLSGLVRHVKGGLMILKDLFELEMFEMDDYTQDLCLAAFALHDIQKQGDGSTSYSVFDHPLLAAEYIRKCNEELGEEDGLPQENIDLMCEMVSRHMGKWNTSKRSKVELPKPESKFDYIVHLADYISSRKYLECRFEEDDITVAEISPSDYIITFGKYKGSPASTLLQDTSYVKWLIDSGMELQEPLATFVQQSEC